MYETRRSLIERLADPSDNPSWTEFYAMYWEPIVRYARKLGLSEADAHDVLQETMMALARILPGFRYDPARGRFRNFLLTIVHRKSLSAVRRARRRGELSLDAEPEGEGAPLGERLAADPAPDPGKEEERRWQEALLEKAMADVRRGERRGEHTMDVFVDYVLKEKPCAEVARNFGMKENAVYQNRSRVIGQLKSAVARMAGPAEEPAPAPAGRRKKSTR